MKIGGIMALSGGILMIIGGITAISLLNTLRLNLMVYGLTFSSYAELLFGINITLTFVFGILGLIGGLIVILMNNKPAAIIILIIGITATVGMIVPIGYLNLGILGIYPVSLNGL